MIVENIINLAIIAVSYLFLFALLPFWIIGFRLRDENAMDNLVSSFILGNIIIINCVLILALIGIYSRLTLVASFFLVAIVYRWFFKREETMRFFKKVPANVIALNEGYYSKKILIQKALSPTIALFKSLPSKIGNPIYPVITLGAFVYVFYVMAYHAVVNLFFGTSDKYLHLEWIKFLNDNTPFSGGVYPFGMHAVVSAMENVFGFDSFFLLHRMGPVTGLLVVFILYYILSSTFKSKLAVTVGVVFYCILDSFHVLAVERQALMLPQEFGMIFLYLPGFFLIKYLRDNKIHFLISMSGALSMTFIIHMFNTIYALILCGIIFVAHLAYLDKNKFLNIIIGGISALFIAVLPLGIALALGNPLHYAFHWALGVMGIGDGFEGTVELAPTIYEIDTAAPIVIREDYTVTWDILISYINHYSGLSPEWIYALFVSVAACVLFPIFNFGKRGRRWDIFGYAIYCIATLAILIVPQFGLPAVVEYGRALNFFIFSVPLVLPVVLELVYGILHSFGGVFKKIFPIVHTIFSVCIVFFCAYYILAYENFRRPTPVFQFQHNGQVQAFIDIKNNFPPLTWTIVSAVEEYPLALHHGWHYTVSSFIIRMNDTSPDYEIIIPTRYVFVYVNKRPFPFARLTSPQEIEAFPTIDVLSANENIDDWRELTRVNPLVIYQTLELNRILHARVYTWAREYMRYFPNEMSVFFEDDDIIVFKIRQNPYALNNFNIS